MPELDLWLLEEPGQADTRQDDRAHRLMRLQLTVAELEEHAAAAESAGNSARAADLRSLANELRAKHAKWDRRTTGGRRRWHHVLRRYVFDRRRRR